MAEYRVLLVDDEEELVATLVERLEYRGFDADFAADGHTALKKLRESTFDVMVVDYKLPGMSGEELVQTVKAAYPDLPILMVTGHGAEELGKGKELFGIYDFLLKPLDLSDLVAKMKAAIETNEPRRK